MLTVEQSIAEVSRIIQDESYSDDVILRMLNDSVLSIATTLTPQSLAVFDYEVTVSEGTKQSVISEDMLFQRVIAVADADMRQCNIVYRLSDFLEATGFLSMGVKRSDPERTVLVLGKSLNISKIAVNDVIFYVTYIRVPDQHTDVTSSDYLISFDMPQPYTDLAVIYDVCSKIYNEIEDGVDQEKKVTNGFIANKMLNMREIENIIGPSCFQNFPSRIEVSIL